jgi:hypothetical protein
MPHHESPAIISLSRLSPALVRSSPTQRASASWAAEFATCSISLLRPLSLLLSCLRSVGPAIATTAAALPFSCRATSTYRALSRAHDHLSNLAILRRSACVTLAKGTFHTARRSRQPRYTLQTGREQADHQLLTFARRLYTRASSFARRPVTLLTRANTTVPYHHSSVNAPVLRLGRGPRLLTCAIGGPDPEHPAEKAEARGRH